MFQVFAGVMEEEENREKEFWSKRGGEDEVGGDDDGNIGTGESSKSVGSGGSGSRKSTVKKDVKKTNSNSNGASSDEDLNFLLLPHDPLKKQKAPAGIDPTLSTGTTTKDHGLTEGGVIPSHLNPLPVLFKPYLRTSGRLKIFQVKKYIVKKLSLTDVSPKVRTSEARRSPAPSLPRSPLSRSPLPCSFAAPLPRSSLQKSRPCNNHIALLTISSQFLSPLVGDQDTVRE